MKGLEHTALLYNDIDDVADDLAGTVAEDQAAGTAVLVCLGDDLETALRNRLGPAGDVTYMASDRRYARPIDAMRELWAFASDALGRGATRVHSIGEVRLDGGPSDQDWYWYERAANDVLADTPLTATCLFDSRTLPDEALGCLHLTHSSVTGAVSTVTARQADSLLPSPIPVPSRPADVDLVDLSDASAARRAVAVLVADTWPDRADRAKLVVSELVTNAILHGGGSAALRLWAEPSGFLIEVSDTGPGIDDPFAIIRPPDLPRRGAGLWAAHLEATRLHLARRLPTGTVATALIA